MIEVVMVDSECGDWQALYIDGVLVDEGHSISSRDVFKAIAGRPHTFNTRRVSDEVAEMGMPTRLEDLVTL